jgi:peptidoglycan LD-endopeptidase CwlK
MPADLVKRIDLDLLYPYFRDEMFLPLLARLRAKGFDYVATEGFRDMIRSDILWKMFLAGGPRAAPAGSSSHNYGLAVDLCRDIDLKSSGLQPGWDSAHYDALTKECALMGIHHGRAYKDNPHVSYPGFLTGAQLRPLHEIYQKNLHLPDEIDRLKPVWDYLDSLRLNATPKGTTP